MIYCFIQCIDKLEEIFLVQKDFVPGFHKFLLGIETFKTYIDELDAIFNTSEGTYFLEKEAFGTVDIFDQSKNQDLKYSFFLKKVPLKYQIHKNINAEIYWNKVFIKYFEVIPIEVFETIVWRNKKIRDVLPNFEHNFSFYKEKKNDNIENYIGKIKFIGIIKNYLYDLAKMANIKIYIVYNSYKKMIFNKTLELGEKKALFKEMSFFEKFINFILDIIVRKKIKNQFGGKIKAFISGGGPLDYNVGIFLNSLGLPTLQGYGLTEASPVVSCNSIDKIKIETVGKIFKDVEVKIANDGEILVKGENVMLGYWNNKNETEKILRDNWLYTGDIGEIDQEGYLKITDRKKDIIVNAGGDNIAPSKIENLLANYPEIIQSYIYGDKKNYLVALIVVGKELEDRKNKIQFIIDKVNNDLSIIEKIKKFIIIDDPFTIENEMLTPTMKIRRHQVKKAFGDQLEKLYF